MFLTNEWFEPNIFHAKTMVCAQLYVNDGNNKKPHSHARSHGNCLNNKTILKQCERVNNFSCVYVRNYFLIHFYSTSYGNTFSLFDFKNIPDFNFLGSHESDSLVVEIRRTYVV